MKKTAIVLVGLASSTAAASAAPRLAAQESAASRSTESATPPAPADNFDAWLDANYGDLTAAPDGYRTERAPREASEIVAADAEQLLLIATGAIVTIDQLASRTVRILAPRAIKTTQVRKVPVSYPLVDGRGDIMCANIATKGGSKRVCEDRSGMRVPLSSLELL